MFYPDVRDHISPSALSTWLTSKSAFIQRYFAGEEFRPTASMRSGIRIHALIEGGMLEVPHRYEHSEKKLEFELIEGVTMLGYPDSHEETNAEEVNVVDYKTGHSDTWDELRMQDDTKVMTTAWLVLKANPDAQKVHSHIDYIEVEWDEDAREHVPTGKQKSYTISHTRAQLEKFTKTILKAVKEINKEYESWTDLPVEEIIDATDLEMYETLLRQKKAIEKEIDMLNERIEDNLKFFGKYNAKTSFGTFYFRTSVKYDYPDDLPVETKGRIMDKADAEKEQRELAGAVKQAQKAFEADNDPIEVVQTLAFRAATKKD